jgi:hypothetical protein
MQIRIVVICIKIKPFCGVFIVGATGPAKIYLLMELDRHLRQALGIIDPYLALAKYPSFTGQSLASSAQRIFSLGTAKIAVVNNYLTNSC